jgi:hypothetical protein
MLMKQPDGGAGSARTRFFIAWGAVPGVHAARFRCLLDARRYRAAMRLAADGADAHFRLLVTVVVS